ncbi:type II toxin-antitoxin system HicB family antitoxin [Hymenobacter sp. PAMC 26628]|uniref:type II toxin-antitoxin system HicB family antitoxin n=1 Tax=Hymenobacter sp. PAMC 26628 TaxID=1484118 RepID=UPI00090066C2|nr:HicB family protein [Hymenobacter sp. PAMC 26628]
MTIETEREANGRWLAELLQIAGALAYGPTREQAIANAQALALRVIAEQLELG